LNKTYLIKAGYEAVITTDAATTAQWSFIEDPATAASAPVDIPVSTTIMVGPYQIDRRINIVATSGLISNVAVSIVFYDPINSPTFQGQVYGVNPFWTVTSTSSAGPIPIVAGVTLIGGTAAKAMTLAAPTTAQNGMIITISNNVSFAHTVTSTSNFYDGATGAKSLVTMAALRGASIMIMALAGKWHVLSTVNCTVA